MRFDKISISYLIEHRIMLLDYLMSIIIFIGFIYYVYIISQHLKWLYNKIIKPCKTRQ